MTGERTSALTAAVSALFQKKSKSNPFSEDLLNSLEITKDKAYVFSEKITSVGGLPYKTQGKLVALISRGIDSPVATWMMMRRGCEIICLHFGEDKKEINKVTEKMIHLAETIKRPRSVIQKRALNQMAREVFIAQASDWAFLMTAGTAVQYSEKKTRDHLHRFLTLEREFYSNQINEGFLRECEWKNNLFPNIDYRIFAKEC